MLADRPSEPDERFQATAGEAGEQPVEQLTDRVYGEGGGEDRADHLLHHPGARELPAARLHRGQDGGLLVGELVAGARRVSMPP